MESNKGFFSWLIFVLESVTMVFFMLSFKEPGIYLSKSWCFLELSQHEIDAIRRYFEETM